MIDYKIVEVKPRFGRLLKRGKDASWAVHRGVCFHRRLRSRVCFLTTSKKRSPRLRWAAMTRWMKRASQQFSKDFEEIDFEISEENWEANDLQSKITARMVAEADRYATTGTLSEPDAAELARWLEESSEKRSKAVLVCASTGEVLIEETRLLRGEKG